MPRTTSIKSGDIYPTNNSGDVKVIHYKNYKEITIEFINTGEQKIVRLDNLKNGLVKDDTTNTSTPSLVSRIERLEKLLNQE